ncbi:hypothetical protein ACHQM5_020332 [Ranunculus cassubicifolius]
MWSSSLPLHLLTLVAPLFCLLSIAQSTVPANKTFTFVARGFRKDFLEDTQLDYIDVPNFETHPFGLCIYGPLSAWSYFYSVAPYTPIYTLAIRLNTRVVWEANRGKPFGQNSTIKFGSDGNLVLADPKGRLIWHTNTANKGVVDIKLLKDGNLVLQDTKGRNIWQSFNHPTDVLLVGQSLLPGDMNKLVSRISVLDNNAGPYSLVLDDRSGLILSYKSKISPKPEIYSRMEKIAFIGGPFSKMTLQSTPADGDPFLYELRFNFTYTDSGTSSIIPPGLTLKYDTTYSYLQLRPDGNVKVFTFFDKVNQPISRSPYDEVYSVFSRREFDESECQLPMRCGEFGLCENNQCVACPTSKGLMGWSNTCRSPKLPKCNGSSSSNVVDYYRLDGVEHFSSNFSGNEPVKLADCREQCSKDCKCLGFFYRRETSNCLVTYQLNTLTRVANLTHIAFIKMAK